MNLYILLVRDGSGWTPCFTLFETREVAETYAATTYTAKGTEWRLVLVPAVLFPAMRGA